MRSSVLPSVKTLPLSSSTNTYVGVVGEGCCLHGLTPSRRGGRPPCCGLVLLAIVPAVIACTHADGGANSSFPPFPWMSDLQAYDADAPYRLPSWVPLSHCLKHLSPFPLATLLGMSAAWSGHFLAPTPGRRRLLPTAAAGPVGCGGLRVLRRVPHPMPPPADRLPMRSDRCWPSSQPPSRRCWRFLRRSIPTTRPRTLSCNGCATCWARRK